jgi:translation elongation factor EF-Tu-like GTPase
MANGFAKFMAKLSLGTKDEGGRRTPIPNGFRTDLKFDDAQYRMVVIEFEKELLFPGESISAVCNILLHSEREIDHLLDMGSTIIADGPNVIGSVELEKVIEREKISWEDT